MLPIKEITDSVTRGVKLYQTITNGLENYHKLKASELISEVLKNYRDGAIENDQALLAEFEKLLDRDLQEREQLLKIFSFSYRTLLDAVDERILPSLAKLTAKYLEKIDPKFSKPLTPSDLHITRGVDGFFRGTCRTLTDLTYEEYQCLVGMIREVASLIKMPDHRGDDAFTLYRANPKDNDMHKDGERKIGLANRAKGDREKKSTLLCDWLTVDATHGLRIFQLLKVHALAMDHMTGGFVGISGPAIIVIDRETIERLNNVLV